MTLTATFIARWSDAVPSGGLAAVSPRAARAQLQLSRGFHSRPFHSTDQGVDLDPARGREKKKTFRPGSPSMGVSAGDFLIVVIAKMPDLKRNAASKNVERC